MNAAVSDFHFVIREVDLAVPDAAVKLIEGGRLASLVDRISGGAKQEEDGRG